MWIKIDTQLASKPEVFKIASTLGLFRAEVVGHLVSVWAWFDQNSEDGEIEGCCTMIDEITRPAFADAMQEVGWLSCDNGTIRLPNFDKHNGSTAKKRAMGQQRQERFRNKGGDAPSVKTALLDKKREDKKRENTPFEKVVELWNFHCEPKVTKLHDKRKTQIRALCKEYTIGQIEIVFAKVKTIPFLVGENDRGWRADFDYTTKLDKFAKIEEGAWDVVTTGAKTTTFDEWNGGEE